MTKLSRVKQSGIERSWWSRFLDFARNDNVVILQRIWVVFVITTLVVIYWYGYQKMYFHQDDLDWMIMVNRNWSQVMSMPIGDHVNYVFRILFKLEWDVFGFNYPPYLVVSLLMHLGVTWLIYLIAKKLSSRVDLAASVALLFVVNTNWTESLLWVSGQTISITALFVLVSIYSILQKKREGLWLWLSSWTSGLAIGHLLATAIENKKNRWWALLTLLVLVFVYAVMGGDGTRITPSLVWGVKTGLVWGLMIINSVVGRLAIPFDRFEMIRIGIVGVLVVSGLWKGRKNLSEIWRDKWSRFLILEISLYYLIVAIGRSQYGVGIMRAERYAYLGLALILLLLVRIVRRWEVGKWVWIVPVLVLSQIAGFGVRANYYIQRPVQLKKLVEEMRKTDPNTIITEDYLPYFVLNDERLRYGDLVGLIK